MKTITPPLTEEVVTSLKAGDKVTITGTIYTARDAAHKRLVESIRKGESLPLDLHGQIIYYVGPTPPRPGMVIGSAGPTTSERMDPLTEPLLEQGLKAAIGKGYRSSEVVKALKKHHAVYMVAIGGAGALLSKKIKSSETIAYEDLGTEAIRRLTVEDFPAIVAVDTEGNDIYKRT